MYALNVTKLTKKYGDFTAVDELSLIIKEGELFSLLGVNGAGKTTTLKMLSCLIKPTSGDAEIFGDSLKNPIEIKKKLNITPQETAVAANLTVEENLEFIAGIYGQKKAEAKENASKIISQFSLDEHRKIKARKLSGGLQRRLSLAMALISSPRILFLDEPTVGLDVISRRELWKTIRQLKSKMTIILTTHYLEEAEALSDRVGVMVGGKLAAVGTVEELLSQTKTSKLDDAFIVLSGGEV